jgi:hypothetical protein
MINLFKEAFEWLLEKGIVTAVLIMNLIYVLVFVALMYVLNWYHKNH